MNSTAVAGALVVCCCVVGCGTGSDPAATPSASPSVASSASPSPSQSPLAGFDDPGAAIAAYLADQGLDYAGVCQEAALDSGLSKYCSTVAADRGSELVVKVGEVASEYTSYLLIQRTDGGWLVVRSAEFPYPDDDGTLPFLSPTRAVTVSTAMPSSVLLGRGRRPRWDEARRPVFRRRRTAPAYYRLACAQEQRTGSRDGFASTGVSSSTLQPRRQARNIGGHIHLRNALRTVMEDPHGATASPM